MSENAGRGGGAAGREHALAIQRSPYSYFQPSWELGLWDDFERPWNAFRQRMVDMERHMDEMYQNFWRSDPMFERSFGGMASPGASPFSGTSPFPPSSRPPALHRSLSHSKTEPSTPTSGVVPTSRPALSEITSSSLCPYGFGREFDDLCKIGSEPLPENAALPIVTAPDGTKNLKLTFDVRQFKPQEIEVKTQDSRLLVTAKHDETTDNSRVYREFHRMFTLPAGVTPESLKSSLSAEGVLSIEAPLEPPPPAVAQETVIPITHEKTNSITNS